MEITSEVLRFTTKGRSTKVARCDVQIHRYGDDMSSKLGSLRDGTFLHLFTSAYTLIYSGCLCRLRHVDAIFRCLGLGLVMRVLYLGVFA